EEASERGTCSEDVEKGGGDEREVEDEGTAVLRDRHRAGPGEHAGDRPERAGLPVERRDLLRDERYRAAPLVEEREGEDAVGLEDGEVGENDGPESLEHRRGRADAEGEDRHGEDREAARATEGAGDVDELVEQPARERRAPESDAPDGATPGPEYHRDPQGLRPEPEERGHRTASLAARPVLLGQIPEDARGRVGASYRPREQALRRPWRLARAHRPSSRSDSSPSQSARSERPETRRASFPASVSSK